MEMVDMGFRTRQYIFHRCWWPDLPLHHHEPLCHWQRSSPRPQSHAPLHLHRQPQAHTLNLPEKPAASLAEDAPSTSSISYAQLSNWSSDLSSLLWRPIHDDQASGQVVERCLPAIRLTTATHPDASYPAPGVMTDRPVVKLDSNLSSTVPTPASPPLFTHLPLFTYIRTRLFCVCQFFVWFYPWVPRQHSGVIPLTREGPSWV